MRELPLLSYSELSKDPAERWIFGVASNNDPLIHMVNDLMFSMRAAKVFYLTGPQIGYAYRIVSIEGEKGPEVFVNPKIVDTFGETTYKLETCSSLPEFQVKIKRPEIIQMRSSDPYGAGSTRKFVGLTARFIQHAMDHLDGIDFITRATKYHRDKAWKAYEVFHSKKTS